MFTLFRILSSIISIYMLLIFFRIILTWFQGPHLTRPLYYVSRVTDPYLNWFRRFSFLRTQGMDFSPLAGIMVLVILSNVLDSVAIYGRITLGLVLAITVSALWSAIAFFLMFFLIIALVRLIGMLFNVNTGTPIWMTLDRILEPASYRLSTAIFKNRSLTYRDGLLLTAGVVFLARVLGSFVMGLIIQLVRSIPF